MKVTHYIGADPGHSGGIGMINAAGTYAVAHSMPTRKRGEVIEVDTEALILILRPWLALPGPTVALEWPSAWPGTFGNVGRDAMNFGKGLGVLDTVFHMLKYHYVRVPPNQWKAKLGLCGKAGDAKSEQGVILWDKTYPAFSGLIRGPRGGIDDGKLDALLVAHWLRVGGESATGWKGGKRPPTFRNIPTEMLNGI